MYFLKAKIIFTVTEYFFFPENVHVTVLSIKARLVFSKDSD